jgi:hypothetical protein
MALGRVRMSSSTDGFNDLLANLGNRKWRREGDLMVAPHGTIWLHDDLTVWGTGPELLDRMRGRLARILATRDSYSQDEQEQWKKSYDDTFGLVSCLKCLFGCGGEGAGASGGALS